MLEITLVGYGNVGQQLAMALVEAPGISLKQIYTRTPVENRHEGVPFVHELNDLLPTELVLLAVPDDAIPAVSNALPEGNALVAHTAGSVAMDVIKQERRAVFYPLQTFSKERTPNWQEIPICIEAAHLRDLEQLLHLGQVISPKVYSIDSEARLRLHLAAVLVNNFGNYLMGMAGTQLEEAGLPSELILPLMQETIDKLKDLSPDQAQTGPAVRDDWSTMQRHLELLTDSDQKALYSLFSQLIQKQHGHEL